MKRSIRAFHLPSLRAERYRAYRYRSSLQEGVIHVRIVQIGELRPHCEISNCTAEANYHYNGGHYCWQHRPAPDYCGPEQNNSCVVDTCRNDAVDGEAFCKEHMLYLGPERPEQWPGGAA